MICFTIQNIFISHYLHKQRVVLSKIWLNYSTVVFDHRLVQDFNRLLEVLLFLAPILEFEIFLYPSLIFES